jgi:hypothetical protein
MHFKLIHSKTPYSNKWYHFHVLKSPSKPHHLPPHSSPKHVQEFLSSIAMQTTSKLSASPSHLLCWKLQHLAHKCWHLAESIMIKYNHQKQMSFMSSGTLTSAQSAKHRSREWQFCSCSLLVTKKVKTLLEYTLQPTLFSCYTKKWEICYFPLLNILSTLHYDQARDSKDEHINWKSREWKRDMLLIVNTPEACPIDGHALPHQDLVKLLP